MMLDALLEDEDETIDLLKSDEALERLIDFLLPIQKEFKSEKIAKQLNETLVDIKNNKYATVYDHYYRYLKRKINKANKVLEEN
jgi:hypothetical protein